MENKSMNEKLLEQRAEEYANKKAIENNMPADSNVILYMAKAYIAGATEETKLLSEHIVELQADKGRLTDINANLEQNLKWVVKQKESVEQQRDLLRKEDKEAREIIKDLLSVGETTPYQTVWKEVAERAEQFLGDEK